MRDMKEKAKKAVKKKPLFGLDVDIKKYSGKTEVIKAELNSLPEEIRKKSLDSGIDTTEKNTSGTFYQMDNTVIKAFSKIPGLEIMSIKDALKKHDWLKDYYWKAVPVDQDKFTAEAELHLANGYFIRAKKNAKIDVPLQACLFIKKNKLLQNVHNIIIAEEGSSMNILTGCATGSDVNAALHIGISEFFIKKNATINFTMIHNWAEDVEVKPRSAAILEDNATFISNYILLNPVRNLQMYPAAFLEGKNARASFNSIIYGRKGSLIDQGSKAILRGENTKAEIVSRVITTDDSHVIARAMIIGNNDKSKGHLECRGLKLSDDSVIHAIPELNSKASGADLSHEAAIGKIAQEEIVYLVSRGLSEDEARSLIIRGFMNIDIKGLPPALKKQIDDTINKISEEGKD